MGKVVFQKDGEKFEAGEYVILPRMPSAITGRVCEFPGGVFLVIERCEMTSVARRISDNLNLYGQTADGRYVALW